MAQNLETNEIKSLFRALEDRKDLRIQMKIDKGNNLQLKL